MMDYNPGEDFFPTAGDAAFERYLQTLTDDEQAEAIHERYQDMRLFGEE